VIVLIAGIQLFALSDFTNRFFAWTITPALTATFLGSGYWASLPLLYFSSRQATWSRARLSVFGVLLFSLLTLFATLVNLDRFHLASADPIAFTAAWVWLIVYLIFPLALFGLIFFQMRQPGQEPPRQALLPLWLRAVLDLQGAILVGLGVVLLISPTIPIWPWMLTPLTGRAVAAWLVGMGVIAIQASRENDWHRVDSGFLSFAIFAGLQVLALCRYPASVDWGRLPMLIYLGFLAGLLLVGIYGWLKAQQFTRSTQPKGHLSDGNSR
jgi:hypothetical protein